MGRGELWRETLRMRGGGELWRGNVNNEGRGGAQCCEELYSVVKRGEWDQEERDENNQLVFCFMIYQN